MTKLASWGFWTDCASEVTAPGTGGSGTCAHREPARTIRTNPNAYLALGSVFHNDSCRRSRECLPIWLIFPVINLSGRFRGTLSLTFGFQCPLETERDRMILSGTARSYRAACDS